jgi:hypothetical protein
VEVAGSSPVDPAIKQNSHLGYFCFMQVLRTGSNRRGVGRTFGLPLGVTAKRQRAEALWRARSASEIVRSIPPICPGLAHEVRTEIIIAVRAIIFVVY